MSQEDADRICTNAVNAVKDRNVHTYMFLYVVNRCFGCLKFMLIDAYSNVVYGRKPESPVDP